MIAGSGQIIQPAILVTVDAGKYSGFDKDLHQIGVQQISLRFFLQNLQSPVAPHCRFVGPVRGCESVVDVANRHDF